VCRCFALAAFVMGVGLLATPTSQANISGAIYTTDIGGTVNQNVYATKPDVYLQGGPSSPTAAGLTPGFYYCQVTTPNGGVLGKTLDPVIEVNAAGSFVVSYQLIDILYTGSSVFTVKGFDDTTNAGGEYKVWISQDSTFPNAQSKTDNFKVLGPDGNPPPPPPPEDPPPLKAELCAVKFYDSNANGAFDTGEVTIADWLVGVTGFALPDDPIPPLTLSTPSCTLLDAGIYSVTEFDAVEGYWIHTAVIVDNHGVPFVVPGSTLGFVPDIALVPDDHVTVSFGNVCIGAGGGKTLGFWSNKNGQRVIGDFADDIVLLGALSLRNANGTDFVPTTYGAFRTWLLNGTATNMSYMLSVQLATMELNVHYGLVNGFGLVYAPELLTFAPVAGLNGLGFIPVGDLMAAADAALAANGSAVSGNADRAYQEALKDALDDGNNNLNFVHSTYDPLECPFSFVLP